MKLKIALIAISAILLHSCTNSNEIVLEKETLKSIISNNIQDIGLFNNSAKGNLREFKMTISKLDTTNEVLEKIKTNLSNFDTSYSSLITNLQKIQKELFNKVELTEVNADFSSTFKKVESIQSNSKIHNPELSEYGKLLLSLEQFSGNFCEIVDNDKYPYDDWYQNEMIKDLNYNYKEQKLKKDYSKLILKSKSEIDQLLLLQTLEKDIEKYRFIMSSHIIKTWGIKVKRTAK